MENKRQSSLTSWKVGRGFGKQLRWMARGSSLEINIRKTFLVVGEACEAFFWPTPGFKGGTLFVNSRFSAEGVCIILLWGMATIQL